MKNINFYLLSLIFLLTSVSLFARQYPPGEGGNGVWVRYRYSVNVNDQNNNPKANVKVRLVASYDVYQGVITKYVYKTGYTNSYGYIALEIWVNVTQYWPNNYDFDRMYVLIDDPDYSILSSQNTTSFFPTAYGSFKVVYDRDGDLLDDNLELQLAQKFSPVLHKHSWDKQQGLSSVEWITNSRSTLKGFNTLGQTIHSSTLNSVNDLHVHTNSSGDWDSYGIGDHFTLWKFDIIDSYRYQGAPIGERPIYYHVYQQGSDYFVQYWYFFNMNDISNNTVNHTWHEGDFEHVSIKVNSTTLEPEAVNFYRHEGGKTIDPNFCWWGSTNTPTYNGIRWGYDSNHTHLHVWIAANSHASYNRNDLVYRLTADGARILQPGCVTLNNNEHFWDNVDYNPSGYDLYFEYDKIENLGEFQESPLQQASNGSMYPYAHSQYWFEHYEPVKYSKPWLTFTGRFGDYWGIQCIPITKIHESTESPLSPVYGGDSHEWLKFTENYTIKGFGNPEEDKRIFGITFLEVTKSFDPDPSDGD